MGVGVHTHESDTQEVEAGSLEVQVFLGYIGNLSLAPTREFSSVIKNEIMSFSGGQVDLKIIMFNKMSHHICMT